MWQRFEVAALYAGGLLGPLGGGVAAPAWRPLSSGRMGLLPAGAFLSYLGASAPAFLVTLPRDPVRRRPVPGG